MTLITARVSRYIVSVLSLDFLSTVVLNLALVFQRLICYSSALLRLRHPILVLWIFIPLSVANLLPHIHELFHFQTDIHCPCSRSPWGGFGQHRVIAD
ncbi:hypothetical protein PoB_006068100 [Plakobranchus ocellatus]|uniref:G-protein coupled receptors family 1 profile domain-containing protein n=1 Tax=Plakobranchus ocellatus TaxID=259542 RepID=A0AAV4CQP0_9GAST|nr:hypothetical protein PoB_006068100 [Plakobranchus ocellatus]